MKGALGSACFVAATTFPMFSILEAMGLNSTWREYCYGIWLAGVLFVGTVIMYYLGTADQADVDNVLREKERHDKMLKGMRRKLKREGLSEEESKIIEDVRTAKIQAATPPPIPETQPEPIITPEQLPPPIENQNPLNPV